jgi:hypothetical protein
MVRKASTILLFTLLIFDLSARNSTHAVGLRGGISSGFEYRYYFDEANSVKLLGSSRNKGLQLHAMYEQHSKGVFNFSKRLVLFYGGGIHAGYESWNKTYYVGHTRITEPVSRPLAGIDLIAGVEYPFFLLPVSLGFEVKPFVDFWGKNFVRVQPFDFAFTAKFHF